MKRGLHRSRCASLFILGEIAEIADAATKATLSAHSGNGVALRQHDAASQKIPIFQNWPISITDYQPNNLISCTNYPNCLFEK